MALKNGYTSAAVADAAIGGVTTAMSAIFILLAVGALIGTWNMAGTIPTVVDYGARLLNPTIFFVTTAAICAVVGMVTGSSWTTAGTLGVAFVGMATIMGLSTAAAAGSVICGAYFGDKMSPLSETTILVPQLVGGGLTTGQHVRNMFWTAGPALGISLAIFLIIGLTVDTSVDVSPDAAVDALEQAFHISVVNLLPLALLVLFTIRKVPPFLAILGAALFGVAGAFVAVPVAALLLSLVEIYSRSYDVLPQLGSLPPTDAGATDTGSEVAGWGLVHRLRGARVRGASREATVEQERPDPPP